jgi:hypothetical protein
MTALPTTKGAQADKLATKLLAARAENIQRLRLSFT